MRRNGSPLVALRWSHFGTALEPGHMRQVNNLVFWIDDATPDVASSVVGQASDTASGAAKMEPNSIESRETGRPYCIVGTACM